MCQDEKEQGVSEVHYADNQVNWVSVIVLEPSTAPAFVQAEEYDKKCWQSSDELIKCRFHFVAKQERGRSSFG